MIGIEIKHTFYAFGSEIKVTAFFSTVFYYLNENKKWGEKYPVFFKYLYQGKVPIEKIDELEKELMLLKKKFTAINPKQIYWDLFKGEEYIPQNADKSILPGNYFKTEKGTDYFDFLLARCVDSKKDEWDLIMRNMFIRPDQQPKPDQLI